MSVLTRAMYGDLDSIYELLNGDLISLEATQGALMTAIRHIQRLHARMEELEARVTAQIDQPVTSSQLTKLRP